MDQSKPVDNSALDQSKPVENSTMDQSKPVENSTMDQSKPVENSTMDQSKPVENSVMDQSKPVENSVMDQSKPVENSAVDQSKPVENSVMDQSKPVENSALDQSKPVENSALDQSKPIENSVMDQSKPVENSVMDQSKPVENSVMDQSKPVENSAMDQSKPVENSAIDKPKPVENSAMDQSKPVENSVMDQSKPVENSTMDQSKPVENSVMDQSKPVENSAMGQSKPATKPPKNSAMAQSKPATKPPKNSAITQPKPATKPPKNAVMSSGLKGKLTKLKDASFSFKITCKGDLMQASLSQWTDEIKVRIPVCCTEAGSLLSLHTNVAVMLLPSKWAPVVIQCVLHSGQMGVYRCRVNGRAPVELGMKLEPVMQTAEFHFNKKFLLGRNYRNIVTSSDVDLNKVFKFLKGFPYNLNPVLHRVMIKQDHSMQLTLLEHRENPPGVNQLHRAISEGMYYLDGAPITDQEYHQQVEWKRQAAQIQMTALNYLIEHNCPEVIADPTGGYSLQIEELRTAPLGNCRSAFCHIYVEVEAKGDLPFDFDFWKLRTPLLNISVLRFVSELSAPPPDPEKRDSFLRSLSVNVNHTGEAMVQLGVSAPVTEGLKTALTEYFQSGEGKDCNVTSLQLTDVGSTESQSHHVLYGSDHLVEQYGNLKSRVYPDTEMWGQPPGVILMCNTVVELLDLLDRPQDVAVFCGRVFMIDFPPMSRVLEDLRLNNIENCVPVETSDRTCKAFQDSLEGLGPDLRAFRTVYGVILSASTLGNALIKDRAKEVSSSVLEKVVYAFRQTHGNFMELEHLLKKAYKNDSVPSNPLVPVKVVPVDLLPCSIFTQFAVLCVRKMSLQGRLVANKEFRDSALPNLKLIQKGSNNTGGSIKTKDPASSNLKLIQKGSNNIGGSIKTKDPASSNLKLIQKGSNNIGVSIKTKDPASSNLKLIQKSSNNIGGSIKTKDPASSNLKLIQKGSNNTGASIKTKDPASSNLKLIQKGSNNIVARKKNKTYSEKRIVSSKARLALFKSKRDLFTSKNIGRQMTSTKADRSSSTVKRASRKVEDYRIGYKIDFEWRDSAATDRFDYSNDWSTGGLKRSYCEGQLVPQEGFKRRRQDRQVYIEGSFNYEGTMQELWQPDYEYNGRGNIPQLESTTSTYSRREITFGHNAGLSDTLARNNRVIDKYLGDVSSPRAWPTDRNRGEEPLLQQEQGSKDERAIYQSGKSAIARRELLPSRSESLRSLSGHESSEFASTSVWPRLQELHSLQFKLECLKKEERKFQEMMQGRVIRSDERLTQPALYRGQEMTQGRAMVSDERLTQPALYRGQEMTQGRAILSDERLTQPVLYRGQEMMQGRAMVSDERLTQPSLYRGQEMTQGRTMVSDERITQPALYRDQEMMQGRAMVTDERLTQPVLYRGQEMTQGRAMVSDERLTQPALYRGQEMTQGRNMVRDERLTQPALYRGQEMMQGRAILSDERLTQPAMYRDQKIRRGRTRGRAMRGLLVTSKDVGVGSMEKVQIKRLLRGQDPQTYADDLVYVTPVSRPIRRSWNYSRYEHTNERCSEGGELFPFVGFNSFQICTQEATGKRTSATVANTHIVATPSFSTPPNTGFILGQLTRLAISDLGSTLRHLHTTVAV
uniref:Uncharacterized protein n=1 Tax=Timema douglasi TaxID=61478 RepID=A0A7R8VIX2_TIMDO|nr:unnamed protein product [Timema douglasi]